MEKVTIDSGEPHVFKEGIDRYGLSEPLETSDIAINYYRVASGEGFPGGLHTHMDQEEVFVVIDGEATFETLAPGSGADCANSEGRSLSDSWKSKISNGQGIFDSLRHASGQRGGETVDRKSFALSSSRKALRAFRTTSKETAEPSPSPRAADETVSEDGEVTVSDGEAIRFAPGEFQSGKNETDGELVVLAMGAPRDSEDIRIPAECPECHHDDLRLDTGGDGPSFVCPDCEAEHFPRNCPECGRDDLRITLDEATKTAVICQNCGTTFENPPLRN